MKETEDSLIIFETISKKYRISEIVEIAERNGWVQVWQEFSKVYDKGEFKDDQEKNIFVDLFFGHCLKAISAVEDKLIFWELIKHWLANRNLETRSGALSHDEKIALIHFCVNLRIKLREFLTQVPPEEVEKFSDEQQRLMVCLWRQVFFEPFSAMNLSWNPSHKQPELTEQGKNAGYAGLLVASMYQPFSADEYDIDAEKLISTSMPFCYKSTLIYWMVSTPYFNSEEKHRQKLLKYVPQLCKAINRHPQILSSSFFLTFVQEVMTGFWRASYIGGNNVEALSAFGDLISFVMTRSFHFIRPKSIRKKLDNGEKLRIGYISRNFYKQAVSCYMVNRVIYHDPSEFEVYIFALGDYHDDISELFAKHSEHFERFANMTDISGIMKSILEKNLDILIYTDIGMDPVTYILSGLQLAPIQCAMVGHGTTTGIPTIQYYISGDFESPEGDIHYRERLIRLPKLGAAQYLPITPEEKFSRKDLGIPEDAVVFISCANGIKHGHLRDDLFIEILKQAPNAWVLIKPFAMHASVDRVFATRIVAAARQAGVGDRLMILPPIGHTKHVMGLLAVADVQLDSYPYGGWTTNMEALYMGLAIITQEGTLARSRWGAGMLRALGITEGIAVNEAEYVAWAVKLAQDQELLVKLKKHIGNNVQEVLFNGAAAQPDFEKALINIYNEYFNKVEQQECAINRPYQYNKNKLLSKGMQDVITIATSVTPGNLENQRMAIQSWKDAGFYVVSINAMEELAELNPCFPDIEFIAVERDGRNKYGNPYIYFDDILTYFSNRKGRICGIINSDIYLAKKELYSFVSQEARNSFVYGSRVDIESFSCNGGRMYTGGFDYFFFDRELIQCYPKQEFCINLPWMDYWAILVPLMYKKAVKKVITPVAFHINHVQDYSKENWITLGNILGEHFRPPFKITAETIQTFAQETLMIINELTQKLSL